MNYSQRAAAALFHAGLLNINPELNILQLQQELDKVAATINAQAPLVDQDFLSWLHEQAANSGLPECEICAQAWHLTRGRDEDFAVRCKNYAAGYTKTVAEGVAQIREKMAKSNEERARFKREEAEKLLAEAEELLATKGSP